MVIFVMFRGSMWLQIRTFVCVSSIVAGFKPRPIFSFALASYIHTYTLFILEIYRVAIQLISSRKEKK